jgi:hypothetical protein
MDARDRASATTAGIQPGLLARLTAGPQDPDVEPLTFEDVLWVRDRALGGGLVGPSIVLQLVESYFEARGSRTPEAELASGANRTGPSDV